MKYLITIYILIIIIQYFYSKHYTIKFNNEQIVYNNKNYNKLFDIFINELQKRKSLLENNKMSIEDWFEYANKNEFLIIDGYKYYLFIDELVEDRKNIIQRAYGDESYNDLSWADMLKLSKDTLIFTKYTTNEDMEINAYNVVSANRKEGGKIKYFWIDPISSNPSLKETLFLRWDDPHSKRTGLMGIGMSLEYLNQTGLTKYINMIHKEDLLYVSIISFVIALTIHFTEKNVILSYVKSIIFIIISNAYILKYINKYEGRTTIENINSGALSVAFLAGVNIYIIGILSSNSKSFLYIQSSIIFALSISLLMISILQYTNLTEINYMISNRISNELLFNFSIILNMVILINFILHTLYKL